MAHTRLLIDGHVHVYPVFTHNRLFSSAMENLSRANQDDNQVLICLLSERSDCHFFQDLYTGSVKPDGFTSEKTGEEISLRLSLSNDPSRMLYMIAGRQIISAEGLEICALASLYAAPDYRLPARTLISAILDAGGMASINWAPGKWFFSRGHTVSRLIEDMHKKTVVIGDTTMRPQGWPEPALMKKAHERGFHIIAGSDPLPFAGEEEMAGQYGFSLQSEFDAQRPGASLIEAMQNAQLPVARFGSRSSMCHFIRRQWRIMSEKKRRSNMSNKAATSPELTK